MLHVETDVTARNKERKAKKPIIIDGTQYFSAAEITRDLSISRQTLWRWRQEDKIPLGHRYRNGLVLFSAQEVEAIRAHANLLEPIGFASRDQLKLFNGRKKR